MHGHGQTCFYIIRLFCEQVTPCIRSVFFKSLEDFRSLETSPDYPAKNRVGSD